MEFTEKQWQVLKELLAKRPPAVEGPDFAFDGDGEIRLLKLDKVAGGIRTNGKIYGDLLHW